ncbi:MAG: hypothetical protein AAFZ15_14215 [Bacteroidota bacterium]
MKYFPVYLLIALSCISCKNDDDGTPDWSAVSALKNGSYWEAAVKVVDNSDHPEETGLLLFIEKEKDNGWDELMYFVNVPSSVGRYTLPDTRSNAQDTLIRLYYGTGGSDVIGDTFSLSATDSIENYLEITDILDDKIIGKFQLSFFRNSAGVPACPGTPDTVIFTAGAFRTWIRY